MKAAEFVTMTSRFLNRHPKSTLEAVAERLSEADTRPRSSIEKEGSATDNLLEFLVIATFFGVHHLVLLRTTTFISHNIVLYNVQVTVCTV